MADSTILQLPALLTASPPASCSLEIANPTVTTDSPFGSSQRMTVTQLFTSPTIASPTLTGTVTISGATTFGSTVGINGDVTVNVSSPKFTIAESTGNTSISGTVTAAGLITASGGATIAGVGLTLNNVNLLPAADNTCTLGSASFRLADIRSFLATFTNTVTCNNGLNVTNPSTWNSGLGYATGQGGAITQITSATTAVTLNKYCGQITTVAQNLGILATASFTVNNSLVAANDDIRLTVLSTPTFAGSFCKVRTVAAGSFIIDIVSAGNTESAVWIIQMTVLKSVKA